MESPSPTSWTTDPGDDTTEGFVCNWKSDPDAEGFCPLLAAPNANLGGDTPLGGPSNPGADSLRATNHLVPRVTLTLGGEQAEVDGLDEDNEVIIAYTDLHVPDVAETNPPLDPNAPPILSGKLSITGGGWNVSGEFTATLCRSVDLVINCG